MALIMVQGHVFDALLLPAERGAALYQAQLAFHGTTAPGFLFASGFVAGLPRAPLSLRASVRRARRLLFVLLVGYALHLPFFSLWKTGAEATTADRIALFGCDALQCIAATQLIVLALQWVLGRRWTVAAAVLAAGAIAVAPWAWGSPVFAGWPLPVAAYLDGGVGSRFPLLPYAAFVFAGGVAGAALGRQDEPTRRRRAWRYGAGLVALGIVLAILLQSRVDFWGPSPGYSCLRIGGLLILLRLVERAARAQLPGVHVLALLGHETLLVYTLHLYLVYGWLLGAAPLGSFAGRLGFASTLVVLVLMLPVLWAAAWSWHRAKVRAPHEAALALQLVCVMFLYEFVTRPW
jgi:hypothetical protein